MENTVDSIYHIEDGYVLIEMKLFSVIQMFNSFDPAPFREKELDNAAESYIVDVVKDFPAKTQFRIVIYLPDELIGTKDAREIPEAVRSHFQYKVRMERRRFRERYVEGQFKLIVGISFLALATFVSLTIENYFNTNTAAHLLATALQITGWVAMWEPISIFLFQLWPLIKQRKIYERISQMEIVLRPYSKSTTQVPEFPAQVILPKV
jgi:hypothetical protein